MKTLLFPCAQITMCFGAAVMYGMARDWKHMMYWVAAGVLTACVTF